MTTWLIEPRDPVILRDGRPFGPNPGARAKSLVFPFPSTTTGAVRTRAGEDSNGKFEPDQENIQNVLKISTKGPLLAQLEKGEIKEILVHAPNDALFFDIPGDPVHLALKQLQPIQPDDGAVTNMKTNNNGDQLYPIGLVEPDSRKPAKSPPAFWKWSHFEDWLLNPQPNANINPHKHGISGLNDDRRMHVGIDPATLAARDGDLFMTSGRSFEKGTSDTNPSLKDVKAYGLLVGVENASELNMREGAGTLGGERRMVFWKETSKTLPGIPTSLAGEIAKNSGRCRIIFLTPAYFEQGWVPKKLLENVQGITPQLKAAAVDSPIVISGWDYAAKGPKSTKRLVPAGSVYYLDLNCKDESEIQKWLDSVWFNNKSDDEEMNKAGFGLATVGTWPVEQAKINWRSE